jgi:hypothetical protein
MKILFRPTRDVLLHQTGTSKIVRVLVLARIFPVLPWLPLPLSQA